MEEFNILVCDDDHSIVDAIEIYLKQEGYRVIKAYNGLEALKALEENEIHLIILDIMMPQLDGLQATVKIREICNIPILMLSAKSEDTDKVLGLNFGADDYITKPFDINEVIARVQIQLRHAGQEAEPDRIECGGITLDDKTHQIWVDGQEILHLTRQEYAILELLIRHPKQVFRKEAIFTYAWEEEYMGETKTLDVHISNIRKKLKAVTDKEYIQTVWGIGYRLNQ